MTVWNQRALDWTRLSYGDDLEFFLGFLAWGIIKRYEGTSLTFCKVCCVQYLLVFLLIWLHGRKTDHGLKAENFDITSFVFWLFGSLASQSMHVLGVKNTFGRRDSWWGHHSGTSLYLSIYLFIYLIGIFVIHFSSEFQTQAEPVSYYDFHSRL